MNHKEREQLIWLVGYAIGTLKSVSMQLESEVLQHNLENAVIEIETKLDKIMGIEK